MYVPHQGFFLAILTWSWEPVKVSCYTKFTCYQSSTLSMTSSNSSASAAALSLGCSITEKLSQNNHPLWKAQVIQCASGALPQLDDGTTADDHHQDRHDNWGSRQPWLRLLYCEGPTDTQLPTVLTVQGHPRPSCYVVLTTASFLGWTGT